MLNEQRGPYAEVVLELGRDAVRDRRRPRELLRRRHRVQQRQRRLRRGHPSNVVTNAGASDVCDPTFDRSTQAEETEREREKRQRERERRDREREKRREERERREKREGKTR